jgi:hypothetical protein
MAIAIALLGPCINARAGDGTKRTHWPSADSCASRAGPFTVGAIAQRSVQLKCATYTSCGDGVLTSDPTDATSVTQQQPEDQ